MPRLRLAQGFLLDTNAFLSRLAVLLDLDSRNTSASSLPEQSAFMYRKVEFPCSTYNSITARHVAASSKSR